MATDLFVWGLVAHLLADFFLQNEWQALNKTSLKHPAAWVHAGIHLGALLFVFPPLAALALAVSHLLIDTRVPLRWWRALIAQSTDGRGFDAFAIWQDQAAHLLALALVAWVVAR